MAATTATTTIPHTPNRHHPTSNPTHAAASAPSSTSIQTTTFRVAAGYTEIWREAQEKANRREKGSYCVQLHNLTGEELKLPYNQDVIQDHPNQQQLQLQEHAAVQCLMECHEDSRLVERVLNNSVVAQRLAALGSAVGGGVGAETTSTTSTTTSNTGTTTTGTTTTGTTTTGTTTTTTGTNTTTDAPDEWASSGDEQRGEEEAEEEEVVVVQVQKFEEVGAEEIRDRLHYCIFSPRTKQLLQPSEVANALVTCVPGIADDRSFLLLSSFSPSFAFDRDSSKYQYPNIIALLGMAVEMLEKVEQNILVLRNTMLCGSGTGSSKRNRADQKKSNCAREELLGIGHDVLWLSYSVTAGILVHGNWYENYYKDEEQIESNDVRCLFEIGRLLTRIWKQGVLVLSNEELQIDQEDRDDLEWWLQGIQRTFEESTTRRKSGGVDKDGKCDLSFEFFTTST